MNLHCTSLYYLFVFLVPVSQVQVAAAASAVTGAPLHVATQMPPYISAYPQAHPQTFQAPYAHMVNSLLILLLKFFDIASNKYE